jgi:glycosyltransferase involved in cell wall biosynthesis
VTVRVLQSFPHKIGAGRICMTAWHQAAGVADAGGGVTVMTGAIQQPLPEVVRVRTTLARGRLRIPYKAIGAQRALDLHDRIVARALPSLVGDIDVVHTWPLASLHTLRVARRLGIPTVLERPNAHTRFAMESVAQECERLGVNLPRDHEHAYNLAKLAKEEEEYRLADHLLCPSEFVVKTFIDLGTPPEKLLRHTYGFDDRRFRPLEHQAGDRRGLSAIFVGVCAVRKGLHFALEAWLRSSASRTGTFRIAGEFLPDYYRKLEPMLAHPSVEVLGHRDDVPELMRDSDVLLLPSIEEGFGLTCVEAMGSGCVPMVSDACTDVCVDGENALVHAVGDIGTITTQLTMLDADRELLAELRAACLRSAPEHTWTAAGRRLLDAYAQAINGVAPTSPHATAAGSA